MTLTRGTYYSDLEALAAVIAHSQIVVTRAPAEAWRFPAGFDAVDIAVLEWIAAEGRRAGCQFARAASVM